MTVNTSKENPVTKLNLSARQLRELLDPVIPLAGKDDMLPVLTCIWICARGTTVTAAATDRFRVGVSRINVEQSSEFSALLRVRDLRSIMTLFKATRFDNPALEFESFAGGTVTVASTEGFSGMQGASLSLTVMNGQFPDVTGLFEESLTTKETTQEPVGVNGAFLADFKHAVRDGHPLLVKAGATEGKPVLIAAGEHFIGLLMPRRLIFSSKESPDGALASLAKDWEDVLGKKPAPRKAPAKRTAAKKAPARKKAPAAS